LGLPLRGEGNPLPFLIVYHGAGLEYLLLVV
jgi:hypothetical protein